MSLSDLSYPYGKKQMSRNNRNQNSLSQPCSGFINTAPGEYRQMTCMLVPTSCRHLRGNSQALRDPAKPWPQQCPPGEACKLVWLVPVGILAQDHARQACGTQPRCGTCGLSPLCSGQERVNTIKLMHFNDVFSTPHSTHLEE